MPGIAALPPFSAALTPEAVETCTEPYPAEYITSTLLTLSNHLLHLTEKSTLFGKPAKPDAFSPSLRTLYDRLQNGQFGPVRLPFKLLTYQHVKARISERSPAAKVSERPLADFEDLYYAVLSTMKEIQQWLNDHLRSGFHVASSKICEGSDTIGELNEGLCEYWTILNDAACGKAFDDAVRQDRFETVREEIFRLVEIGELDYDDAEYQIDMLIELRADKALEGMQFISAWSPAMISVTLQQKYYSLLRWEKAYFEDDKMRARRQAKVDAAPKKTTVSHKPAASRAVGHHRGRFSVGQVGKKARIEVNNHTHVPQQGEVQDAGYTHTVDEPVTESTYNATKFNHLSQASSTQATEQDRASIDWELKKQRVSAYRKHLRSRASLDARYTI